MRSFFLSLSVTQTGPDWYNSFTFIPHTPNISTLPKKYQLGKVTSIASLLAKSGCYVTIMRNKRHVL